MIPHIKLFFPLIALGATTMVDAQQGNVVPMGLCLENYQYAYPVSYITLEIQHQVLKMAYMDVRPEHPNGHTVMLESYYHGTWSPAYDEWLNIYAGWMLSPEYSRIAWNSALTYDMIFTQPVCYEFGGIKAPALLIVGELDRTALGKNLVPESVARTMGNYPELGRVTATKIPNCKLVELAGVGHVPHVEVFDRFIQPVLEFLNQ